MGWSLETGLRLQVADWITVIIRGRRAALLGLCNYIIHMDGLWKAEGFAVLKRSDRVEVIWFLLQVFILRSFEVLVWPRERALPFCIGLGALWGLGRNLFFCLHDLFKVIFEVILLEKDSFSSLPSNRAFSLLRRWVYGVNQIRWGRLHGNALHWALVTHLGGIIRVSCHSNLACMWVAVHFQVLTWLRLARGFWGRSRLWNLWVSLCKTEKPWSVGVKTPTHKLRHPPPWVLKVWYLPKWRTLLWLSTLHAHHRSKSCAL